MNKCAPRRLSIWRRAGGIVAMASLVFMQAIVAVHACDVLTGAASPQSSSHSQAAPCHSGGEPQAPTCASHCQDAAQTVDAWPGIAFAAPLVPAFVVAPSAARDDGAWIAARDPSLLRAISPPLAIRNCCFRI